MNAKLNRYYRKKMSGGRSLAARTIDFVLFRFFLVFSLFLLFLYFSRSTTVSILISVFITAAVSLAVMIYKRKKAQRFMEKDMIRIKQKCLLETLTLMSTNDYAAYINKVLGPGLENIECRENGFSAEYQGVQAFVFHNHPSSKCEAADILSVYRVLKDSAKIMVISLSGFSDDAKMFSANLPAEITLVSGKEILKMAEEKGLMPNEQAAEEKAEKEMNEALITLENIKNATFGKRKIKGYVVCGVCIMIWPLVTGFRIYYPIIAMICFILAIIAYKKNRQGKESSDIPIS